MESFVLQWLKNWRFFGAAAVIGVAIALSVHTFFNSSEVESHLIVSIALQEKISQLPWEVKQDNGAEARVKREIKDLSLWFKSYDFLQSFLQKNCAAKNAPSFCAEFMPLKERGPLVLMKRVEPVVEDGKILRLRVRGKNPQEASVLANSLVDEVIDRRGLNAKTEYSRFEENMKEKKAELEGRLRTHLQSLSKKTESGGPTLQFDPGKNFSFLADLQGKLADIELQIAENDRVIALLRDQAKGDPSASDYGPGLRLKALRSENQILKEKRNTLSSQIKGNFAKHYLAKSGTQTLTNLQEQLRVDLENYASVTRALERVKLVSSMQEINVEVFQRAAPVLARDRWPRGLLLALGLFLSQLVAIVGFLFFGMWRNQAGRQAFAGMEVDPKQMVFDTGFRSGQAGSSRLKSMEH